MKVLFDYQIFASQRYGGISRYFSEVAKHLAHVGDVDTHVLCPLYVNEYIRSVDGVSVWGEHVYRPPHSTILMRSVNAALSLFFAEARAAVDVYHETYFSRLRAAPRGSVSVVTVHDMIHEKFAAHFSTLDRTSNAKRVAVARADHVICVSENTKRDLLTLFNVDPRRVSVVYHGSSLRARTPFAPTQRLPQLLYVGSRGPYKNFAKFIEALGLSRLPREGVSLVCFGGGPLSRTEEAMIAKLGLRQYVRQVPGSDDILLRLFSESAALVYPSLYEGFGIPVLEAMSCGCPVACSNTSSLPEIVGDAAALFDPTDAESMCKAIESILFSPARSAELVARGLHRSTEFSWERSAAATLDVYRSIT